MEMHTIGHSDHTWDRFASLLKQNGIEALADIRSNPVSRHASFANKRKLPALLTELRIRHHYLGDTLGGKPSDPSYYDENGRPDYSKMRVRPSFHEGIDRLMRLIEDSAVVIMCAEEDPAGCHRTLLIGPELARHGVDLLHIRKDGAVQRSARL